MNRIIACNTAIALSALSINALAQDPAGLAKVEQVSSGSTNVATTGFQSAQKPADEETADFTRLTLGVGGTLAMGNAQVQNYNALGDFGLRRGDNQLGIKASLNQGSASSGRNATGVLEPMKETMSNYQGLLRYDRFFSNVISGFVQGSVLTDKFQGLALRVNADPGIAIFVVNEPTHQWSFDVGYDFQHDQFRDNLAPDQTLHNARVATNYYNALNDSVSFKTGAEYLLALSPWDQCYWATGSDETTGKRCDSPEFKGKTPDDAIEKVNRVNWYLMAYARLDAKVSDKFTVQTALELRHDNSPVALSYALNDLRSSVNLTYQLF